jgi:predicted ArsR family transcriptional regulator
MAALRLALGERAPRTTTAEARKPRENTKQAQVLAMLRQPEGATAAQIAEAMSWAPHTVRGFFAGLKTRHGITVTAAERVRQVGPNQQGAKGSYTVYHIAEAG